MKHLSFITSNTAKFIEARDQLATTIPYLKLDHIPVNIPEIQSDNPEAILKQKIAHVRNLTTLPFIVDDVSFETERYPGFPGSYAKFINETLGYAGLKKLFENGDIIQVTARIALSFLDDVYYFEGTIDGKLYFESVPTHTANNLLSHIISVSENSSLADALKDEAFNSHRRLAFSQLGEWLKAQNSYDQKQKLIISERWTQRSSHWKDTIEDVNSYVNYEDNYSRVNKMISKLAPSLSGDVLEVGCGTGEAGRILKQSNPKLNVLSTDIADGMLVEAKKQTKACGIDINYQKIDIVRDDLGTGVYDLVFSRGVVLSHIPKSDVFDFLESVTKITKQDGFFLFDFIQNVRVGEIEKPIDSKNEFTLGQLDKILNELGWHRIYNDGTDEMRVRVACYTKNRLSVK